jgi:hypothetical protein
MKVNGQLHALGTLRLGKEPQEPTEEKAGWSPEPICMVLRTENSLAPAANWTLIPLLCSPQTSHNTNYTILAAPLTNTVNNASN